jgi:hypothetical protein
MYFPCYSNECFHCKNNTKNKIVEINDTEKNIIKYGKIYGYCCIDCNFLKTIIY